MKNFLSLIFCLALTCNFAFAQNYTGKMASGKLRINEVNGVTIQGHSGNDLQISIVTALNELHKDEDKDKDKDKEKPKEKDRAAGLRELNAKGLVDNTGLGLSVTEKGGETLIEQISRKGNRYLIKIPNSAQVVLEHSTNRGRELSIENFSGDLSVSLHYGSVDMKNVTGPTAINTIYGGIDASYPSKGPAADTRLHSVYSSVDVSVPASFKSNIRMKTSYGKMYTDLEIAVSGEQNSHSLQGSINGGGEMLSLESTYSNIYLRKI